MNSLSTAPAIPGTARRRQPLAQLGARLLSDVSTAPAPPTLLGRLDPEGATVLFARWRRQRDHGRVVDRRPGRPGPSCPARGLRRPPGRMGATCERPGAQKRARPCCTSLLLARTGKAPADPSGAMPTTCANSPRSTARRSWSLTLPCRLRRHGPLKPEPRASMRPDWSGSADLAHPGPRHQSRRRSYAVRLGVLAQPGSRHLEPCPRRRQPATREPQGEQLPVDGRHEVTFTWHDGVLGEVSERPYSLVLADRIAELLADGR